MNSSQNLILVKAIFVFAIFVLPSSSSPMASGCQVETDDKAVAASKKTASPKAKKKKKKDKDEPVVSPLTFSNPVRAKWKVGVRVIGTSKSARNMLVTIPVPNQWPEQRVSMVAEDIPPQIGDVKFRDTGSLRQMVVSIPIVRAKEETIVSMTFLVETSQIGAPADPTILLRPKTNHKAGKPFIGVGPDINFRNSKLRAKVKQLVAEKENIWQEIESIYDWVRDNVETRANVKPNDVVQVFRNKVGCNEDKVGLFVAMCRANKIPARMVWVEGTQYAEFMLVDEDKNPVWIPCNVAGLREFGSYSDPRIIMQKGDSFKVPEKKDRQKFVAEFAVCSGQAKPIVRFIRELLPAN